MINATGFPGSFLEGLNNLAGHLSSFIYNPKKTFQSKTVRLEKACGFWPHTSLNILPTGIEINMYIVNQKDERTAISKYQENIKFYKELEAKKTTIESLFGAKLEWNFTLIKTTHQQVAWRLPSPATDYNQAQWFDIQCVLLLQFSKFRYAIETAVKGYSDEDPERTLKMIQSLRKNLK